MEVVVVNYRDPESNAKSDFEARVPFLHTGSVGVGLVGLQDISILQDVVNQTSRQYGSHPPTVKEMWPHKGIVFVNSNWFAENEFGSINSLFLAVMIQDQFGTETPNYLVIDYIQNKPKNYAWKEQYWKLNSQLGDVRFYGHDAIRSGRLFENRARGSQRLSGSGIKAYGSDGELVWDMQVDLGLKAFGRNELRAVEVEDELILVTAIKGGKTYGHSSGHGQRLVLNKGIRFWNRSIAFWSQWWSIPGAGATEVTPIAWWRHRLVEYLLDARLIPFVGRATYWANGNTPWYTTTRGMIPLGWHILGLEGGYTGAVSFSEAQRQSASSLLETEGAFDPVKILH